MAGSKGSWEGVTVNEDADPGQLPKRRACNSMTYTTANYSKTTLCCWTAPQPCTKGDVPMAGPPFSRQKAAH
eukprot:1139833-Pelagomonas_calceolata.AAC.5